MFLREIINEIPVAYWFIAFLAILHKLGILIPLLVLLS